MALVLKMQIDDKQEHQYIFSTGDDGTIELIPLNVVINGSYQAPEGKAYNLVTVEVPNITLEELNVVTSGTYTAPSGTAYDVVTVDIPEYIFDALTATENGTFTPESGHVYNRVVVNVPTPTPTTETKQVTYTSNGTYTVDKSANVDGMTSVTVTVNVPQSTPTLQTKQVTVTQNGSSVITADTGYDGLEEVDLTVNVSGGGLSNVLKLEYTPSENTNGEDNILTGYNGSGYIVSVIAVIQGSSNNKVGCINTVGLVKRYPDYVPTYDGSSTLYVNMAYVYNSYDTGRIISVGGSSNLIPYTQNSGATSDSTSGTPISIFSTGITFRRINSDNTSSNKIGFMYGETYDIYVIYSE